jgi:hypothetical protein
MYKGDVEVLAMKYTNLLMSDLETVDKNLLLVKDSSSEVYKTVLYEKYKLIDSFFIRAMNELISKNKGETNG